MTVDLPDDGTPGDDEETFEVWRDNLDSVSAFLACRTAWRVAVGFGVMIWLGIDYGAAAPLLYRRNGRSRRRLLADLRLMEAEALPILNDRSSS